MRLSEFVLTKTINADAFCREYFAQVTVTTGYLWWKKSQRRTIHLQHVFWFFVDTGVPTPGLQAEYLARSYQARQMLSDAAPPNSSAS